MDPTPSAHDADPRGSLPATAPAPAPASDPFPEPTTDPASDPARVEGEDGAASGLLAAVAHPTHDQTRAMSRVAGPVFVVCAVLLVPWSVYLYLTLPARQVSHHYDLAWAGFDVALAVALVGTAAALVRLSRLLPIAASALATMLAVDAWFDVVTSPPGSERALAVAMAAVVEVPLAGVALWLAYHGQQLRERAIVVRFLRAVPRERLPRLWRRAQAGHRGTS